MKELLNFFYRTFKRIQAIPSFVYDFNMHSKYASIFQNKYRLGKESLTGRILLLNHQLEKAQTYIHPKENYGKDKVKRLINLLTLYLNKFGSNEITKTSLAIIDSHFKNKYAYTSPSIQTKHEALKKSHSVHSYEVKAGIEYFETSDNNKISYDDLLAFFKSRHSCRTYSSADITQDEIEKAIAAAQTAPSACNRQMSRIHTYNNPNQIKDIIYAQESDTEWCLSANRLFIITTNLYILRDHYERNQGMFDSGLFAMNFVHALNSLNIDSCFKMANKIKRIDKKTKKMGNIPDNEDINILILAGKKDPLKKNTYAHSQRVNTKTIHTQH